MNENGDTIAVERGHSHVNHKETIVQITQGLQSQANRLDHAFCLRLRDSVLILDNGHFSPSALISELKLLRLRSTPSKPDNWEAVGRGFLEACDLNLAADWGMFTGLLIHAIRPNTDMGVEKVKRLTRNLAVNLTRMTIAQQWTGLGCSQGKADDCSRDFLTVL